MEFLVVREILRYMYLEPFHGLSCVEQEEDLKAYHSISAQVQGVGKVTELDTAISRLVGLAEVFELKFLFHRKVKVFLSPSWGRTHACRGRAPFFVPRSSALQVGCVFCPKRQMST